MEDKEFGFLELTSGYNLKVKFNSRDFEHYLANLEEESKGMSV